MAQLMPQLIFHFNTTLFKYVIVSKTSLQGHFDFHSYFRQTKENGEVGTKTNF